MRYIFIFLLLGLVGCNAYKSITTKSLSPVTVTCMNCAEVEDHSACKGCTKTKVFTGLHLTDSNGYEKYLSYPFRIQFKDDTDVILNGVVYSYDKILNADSKAEFLILLDCLKGASSIPEHEHLIEDVTDFNTTEDSISVNGNTITYHDNDADTDNEVDLIITTSQFYRGDSLFTSTYLNGIFQSTHFTHVSEQDELGTWQTTSNDTTYNWIKDDGDVRLINLKYISFDTIAGLVTQTTWQCGDGGPCYPIHESKCDLCLLSSRGLFNPCDTSLALIDCDDGGFSNGLECLLGVDPNDPDDDDCVPFLMNPPVDLCTYINQGNPDSAFLSNLDCSGGGVSNGELCDSGYDLTDPDSDCQYLEDNSIDECSDPKYSETDCDQGGAIALYDCTNLGFNPNDPSDDCAALINSNVPICSLVAGNPTHVLADQDCDGGGVPNLVECLSGNNPNDDSDDITEVALFQNMEKQGDSVIVNLTYCNQYDYEQISWEFSDNWHTPSTWTITGSLAPGDCGVYSYKFEIPSPSPDSILNSATVMATDIYNSTSTDISDEDNMGDSVAGDTQGSGTTEDDASVLISCPINPSCITQGFSIKRMQLDCRLLNGECGSVPSEFYISQNNVSQIFDASATCFAYPNLVNLSGASVSGSYTCDSGGSGNTSNLLSDLFPWTDTNGLPTLEDAAHPSLPGTVNYTWTECIETSSSWSFANTSASCATDFTTNSNGEFIESEAYIQVPCNTESVRFYTNGGGFYSAVMVSPTGDPADAFVASETTGISLHGPYELTVVDVPVSGECCVNGASVIWARVYTVDFHNSWTNVILFSLDGGVTISGVANQFLSVTDPRSCN